MRFATIAELRNRLSRYLATAKENDEPIVVTRHGRPYALIQPIGERDLEDLAWNKLAQARLEKAWEGEPDELYDYL